MTARVVLATLTLAIVSGCASWKDELVTLKEVDGSNDHRIFRIGAVSMLMMEPVLWRLEDNGIIDFDQPVTAYFKDELPPEYDQITMRMLHEHRSGLPREFIDRWCLDDICTAVSCGLWGYDLYHNFNARADFTVKLRDYRTLCQLKRAEPQYSCMGYALMMMAIMDATGMTLDQLCEKYLIKPYGLKDTCFTLKPGMLNRLTKPCAGSMPWLFPAGIEVDDHRGGEVISCSGGMYSSASDMLKVGYVILPLIDRAKWQLTEATLENGNKYYYSAGIIYGGNAFMGFEPKEHHVAVVLKNMTCWMDDSGGELLDSLTPPEVEKRR